MNEETLNLLKNFEILIAEDDENLGDSIKIALSKYAKGVMLCEDGESALNEYENGKFDMIITDINLPKMSGLEFAKCVRAKNAQIPIIIITAFDSDKNIQDAMNLGAFAFLQKPFSLAQLYSSLLMASTKVPKDEFINLGKGFKISTKTNEAFNQDELIHLTKTEENILMILLANKGHIVSLEQIENSVWYDKAATPDVIRMHINNLRVKFYYELIQNIRGQGYKLLLLELHS